MEALISYAHYTDPKGCRFVDLASSEIPCWAVDVQPYFNEVDNYCDDTLDNQ